MRIPTLLFFVFLFCQQSFGQISERMDPPSANIYYITPVCQSEQVQSVIMIGSVGGTYSSMPSGLVIDAITGNISPSGSSPGSYVVTYTIAANGGNPSFSTMAAITVNAVPVVTPPPAMTVCDIDGDGFASFDLDYSIPAMVNGAPDTVITFHETQQDAINGTNDLMSPYTNIVPFVQTLFVRAENTVTGCTSFTSLELIVNASPVMPSVPDLVKCDTDSNTQNELTAFDLTVQNPVLLAAQSGSTDYDVKYYTSLANAQAEVAPILSPNNFANTSNPQTIWVVVNNTSTGCSSIGNFQLVVNAPLLLSQLISPLSLCDDGPQTAIPTTVFDLTIKNTEILGSATGHTVTYYPSFADALAGTNAISDPSVYTNIVNPQTLGVKVTTASGCSSYSTLDIRVLPLPTPNTNPATLVMCDDVNNGNGTELFDLTLNEAYIGNGGPYAFEYYTTIADAIAQSNQITTPNSYEMGTGMVYIRVVQDFFIPSASPCFVLVQQSVTVNPMPVVETNPMYVICSNDGIQVATFTLSDMNDDLLGMTNTSDFTISYHMTVLDAQAGTNYLPDSYTNVSNPQFIYARVVNNATGCVNAAGTVTLKVASGATATAPAPLYTCDYDLSTPNGIYMFDLTLLNETVLNGQNPGLFTVAYFSSHADAVMDTNQIANANAYITATATVWIVVTNVVTGCRSNITSLSITVYPLPEPVITSSTDGNAICVEWGTEVLLSGLTLNSGIMGPDHTFQWYLNGAPIPEGTNATFDAVMPGVYEVLASNQFGCSSIPSNGFEVIQSGPPVALSPAYTITNEQDVTVNAQGYGLYNYQLDNGPILDNGGVFENVSVGMHTINVHDVQGGCGSLLMDIEILQGTEDLNFFPNPVTHSLNITFSEKIKTITVYNTLGLEVHQQNFNDFSSQIEISSLLSGTYFVKIDSDKKQKVFRIIKI